MFNQTDPQQQTQVVSNDKTENTSSNPVFPNAVKPIAEQTLLEWKSPSRPFKKRKRQFYSTVAIIVLLVSLILFFAGQFLPIAVVISVAFLVYVLYTIPPGESEHKITNYGVYTDDLAYGWDEIGRYWFDSKFNQDLINFEIGGFPGRVTLLLGNKSKQEFESLLDQILIQERPPDSQIDVWAKWLQEKIPLE